MQHKKIMPVSHRKSLPGAFFSFLPLLLAPATGLGQVAFHQGYILTNEGERRECQIANYGSEQSSMDYHYRFSRRDTARRIDIRYIQAFGVDNKRFFRAKVLIETSPERITTKEPPPLQWQEKHAFVQLLFKGDSASLFFYNDEGRFYFYLRRPDGPFEPLVYKRYVVQLTPNEPSSILENNLFREQLRRVMYCPQLEDELNKLEYNRRSLLDYFIRYHECRGTRYEISGRVARAKMNLKVTTLLNRSTFQIDDYLNHYDFGTDATFSGGLEIEYLIPHNKYKLSLFVEGNYYYRHSSYLDLQTGQTSTIHFQYIEVPLGINYYFILKPAHRLFVRAGISPNFYVGDSYMLFYNPNNTYELNNITNLFAGAGYRFKRLSVEYRYYSKQNITQNVYRRGSIHTRMAFLLKFSFWEPGR